MCLLYLLTNFKNWVVYFYIGSCTMSLLHKGNCIFFLPNCVFLIFCLVLVRISSVMLSRRGGSLVVSRLQYLTPKWEAANISQLSVTKPIFNLNEVSVVVLADCGIVPDASVVLINTIMCSFSFSRAHDFIRSINFQTVNRLPAWNKSHLTKAYSPFYSLLNFTCYYFVDKSCSFTYERYFIVIFIYWNTFFCLESIR